MSSSPQAELLLQQGADPNIFVEYLGGLPTPLFQAVFWGDLKMVKLLCGYGADPYMVKQVRRQCRTARRLLLV